jgi:glyoxylase-like metal-dependent hydrolase (beta-lactamase superfamily II)
MQDEAGSAGAASGVAAEAPEEVAKHIYRLSIPLPGSPLKAVNSYVVRGEGRNLVIDTGMRRKECLDAMASGLDALGIGLGHTDFFITHFHADHLGLVSELAAETARIYLNGPDADSLFAGDFLQISERSARLHGFPEGELKKALDGHPGPRYGPRLPLHVTKSHDGQTLAVGGYLFRCVETPGHSFGHTCLYEAEHGILISGDHILNDITPNLQGWFERWNPLEEYVKSLERTAALDVALVLPGHRSTFRDMRGRIEELIEHHERREEEVLLILEEGPKTAFEVASRMTWDIVCESFDLFPLSQKWFAAGEAIAHLTHLKGLSKVREHIKETEGRPLALWSL